LPAVPPSHCAVTYLTGLPDQFTTHPMLS
jgi:hypothetical protein